MKNLLFLLLFVQVLSGCQSPKEKTAIPPVETSTRVSVTAVGDFYVSPSGNDQNPGTSALPFASLNKAAQVATAGKTVIVRAGTYEISSPIMPAYSGTQAAPIVFKADTGAEVIIDGKTQVPANKVGGLFYILEKNWIVVDGMLFRNSRRDGVQIRNATGVTVQNCRTFNTYASGIVAAGSSNVKVLNNRIRRACQDPENIGTNECLTIASTTDFEVAGNTVYDRMYAPGTEPNIGGEGIDCKNSCVNGKVHHNTVYDLLRTGIYIDAYQKNLQNVEVYGNTVYNITSHGISVASEEGGVLSGVKIHDNLVYDCQKVGIRISGYLNNGPLQDLDIYQNTVTRCGFGTTGTWENVGLLVEADNPGNRNFNIRNNIFAGNAFQMRTRGQSYVTLANNLVFGPTYDTGTGSINADPMFVDPSLIDFRIKSGSPAIDRAAGSPLSTVDIRGQARPLDGNNNGTAVGDLGAYEHRP